MNNHELHEQAQDLADSESGYKLARRVLEVESERDQLAAQNGKFREALDSIAWYRGPGEATALVEKLESIALIALKTDIRQRAKQEGENHG